MIAKREYHGMSKTRIHRIWCNMKSRCYNKNVDNFIHYGGRGIRICDEWNESFMAFYNDMIDGYNDDLSIDRIDNSGNYCKENCRWSTQEVQTRNVRIRKDNKTGYKGVYVNKPDNKFRAEICIDNRSIYLGGFKTASEAAVAYNREAFKHEGFNLNQIITTE